MRLRSNSINCRKNWPHVKSAAGLSVIELLVSTVVIGVAIAGITDLLWMNTSWTRNFLNKTSAVYSTQLFLKRLREDMNSAYRISTESSGQQLKMWLPTTQSKTTITPFPPAATAATDLVLYKLEGSTITRNAGGKSWVVLKGVVGPKRLGSNDITIFQYISKTVDVSDPNYGARENADSGVRSVIIDIEILNRDYGKSRPSESNNPTTSDLVLRAELLARNELTMEP